MDALAFGHLVYGTLKSARNGWLTKGRNELGYATTGRCTATASTMGAQETSSRTSCPCLAGSNAPACGAIRTRGRRRLVQPKEELRSAPQSIPLVGFHHKDRGTREPLSQYIMLLDCGGPRADRCARTMLPRGGRWRRMARACKWYWCFQKRNHKFPLERLIVRPCMHSGRLHVEGSSSSFRRAVPRHSPCVGERNRTGGWASVGYIPYPYIR